MNWLAPNCGETPASAPAPQPAVRVRAPLVVMLPPPPSTPLPPPALTDPLGPAIVLIEKGETSTLGPAAAPAPHHEPAELILTAENPPDAELRKPEFPDASATIRVEADPPRPKFQLLPFGPTPAPASKPAPKPKVQPVNFAYVCAAKSCAFCKKLRDFGSIQTLAGLRLLPLLLPPPFRSVRVNR
jgi:hypothetical protein